jgi:hypothetical protein
MKRHAATLFAAALAAGCVERALPLPEGAPDLGAPDDLLAPGPDLSAAVDLSVADLPQPPDLPAPFDLAPPPLRLLAPLSTSTVTSRRPTLRWLGGSAAARVELCRDRACTQSLGTTTVDAARRRARPDIPLGRGPAFWRVRDGATVTPVWEFFVGARDAAVDNSYGTTLDLNGDGYADFAVGAMGFGNGQGIGNAYLYLGGAAGLPRAPSVTLPGVDPPPDWVSVWQVASAGDLDGDGFGDVVVSSIPWIGSTRMQSGVARVYFGGPAALRSSTPIVLRGPSVQYQFGRSVGGAGDVNGDGYGDLLVTSLNTPSPFFVFLGGPDGVTQSRVLQISPPTQNIGFAAAAGDFNGDGYGDIVIGADQATLGNGLNVGRVYVWFGGPNGLSAPTSIESPSQALNQFGWAVAAADVDGDGYCDVVARHAGNGNTAYVFAGGPAGVATTPTRSFSIESSLIYTYNILALAGDVDDDGRDDLLFGAQTGGGRIKLYLSGPQTVRDVVGASNTFGWSIAGGGDVDRDGHEEVLVGAAVSGAGQVWVFPGSATGPQQGDMGAPPLVLNSGVDGGDLYFGSWVAGRR